MLDQLMNKWWQQHGWWYLCRCCCFAGPGWLACKAHGYSVRCLQAGLRFWHRVSCCYGVAGAVFCFLLVPPSAGMAQHFSLDQGDDPRRAGCVCVYSLPDCKGPVSGRIVDECYPQDGVTLQENTIRESCRQGQPRSYNCEAELGAGARCELQTVDCCGVTTRSARCVLPGADLGFDNRSNG